MTVEEMIEALEMCVADGVHFNIDETSARRLLEYIRELESAATDPRDMP